MKVAIEKSYPMPASAEAVWKLLQDVKAVAGCMPGARITESVDATHHKGTVAVKLGPANLTFKGEIEVRRMDAATKTLQMVGKGTDSTGGSGATLDLTAHVEVRDEETSVLVGTAEVSVSGKAAAFGNRLMGSVSEQVLKQFSVRFTDEVRLVQGRMPKPAAVAVTQAAAVEAAPAAALAPVAASPAQPPSASPAAEPAPAPAPATQLNALGLLWGVFIDWLRGLFSKRR